MFKKKKDKEKEKGEAAADEGEKESGGEEKKAPKIESEDKEAAPAEAGAEGEGEGAPKKKKLGKKKLIIIVAVVLLLAGGGAGAYFSGLLGGGHEEGGGESASDATVVAVPGQPVYYSLPELLVNLGSGGKQASFLKMTVALELGAAEDVQTVEANLPKILDNFNTYLRELRTSDLSGSAGLYRLREELLVRLNKTLTPIKVVDIHFKEIIVQ